MDVVEKQKRRNSTTFSLSVVYYCLTPGWDQVRGALTQLARRTDSSEAVRIVDGLVADLGDTLNAESGIVRLSRKVVYGSELAGLKCPPRLMHTRLIIDLLRQGARRFRNRYFWDLTSPLLSCCIVSTRSLLCKCKRCVGEKPRD